MGESAPSPEQPAATPARRRDWVRRTSDRIPTRWFATAGTVAFLALMAAFGGLETVPEPEIPVLSTGEEHRNGQFALTVQRAYLIDALPEAGLYAEPGRRVLAVVVDAENLRDEAQSSLGLGGLARNVGVEALPDVDAEAVARLDDETASPWFQPGVPATVVLAWRIDPDQGEAEVRVVLRDGTMHTGQAVTSGTYWSDYRTAATVPVRTVDLGTGTSP